MNPWIRYPNDVFVSRWGVVVKRADLAWYAYPTGTGELGPFSSLTQAQSALVPIIPGYARLAAGTPR